MKHGGGEHKDCGVDEKGEHERATRVDGCEFDRFAFAFGRLLESSRLYNRRVQVEIVRHHRRSNDADADIKHRLVGYNVRTGNKSKRNAGEVRFGEDQFSSEASGDRSNQRDDQRFDITETFLLEVKN